MGVVLMVPWLKDKKKNPHPELSADLTSTLTRSEPSGSSWDTMNWCSYILLESS